MASQDQVEDDLYTDFPPVPESLIIALKNHLPERWPDVNWTLRDIDKRAGAHALINLLELVFLHQTNRAQAEKDIANNVLRFTPERG